MNTCIVVILSINSVHILQVCGHKEAYLHVVTPPLDIHVGRIAHAVRDWLGYYFTIAPATRW